MLGIADTGDNLSHIEQMKVNLKTKLLQRVGEGGSIKAVTFDLDDTLWPVWPAVGRAERAMMVWLQQHAPRIVAQFDVEGLRDLRDQIARQKPELDYHISLIRILAMREAAKAVGYAPEVGEQAFEVMWLERNRVDLYEDVMPTLADIRKLNLVIGALSNGNADIDQVGLGNWFDFSLNPINGGGPKPAEMMFLRAADLAQCQPEQIVHVGDDVRSDVAGAAAAGMITVWLNREVDDCGGSSADFEISSLLQLPAILRELLLLSPASE